MPLKLCVVAKLVLFLALGFPLADVWIKSGMVSDSSKVSILVAIPWLSEITCFLKYLMNASDVHLPISIIVYTGVPARNIPIAPPERFECVPTSSGPNPNFSGSRDRTAARIFTSISDEGIVYNNEPSWMRFIGVSQNLSGCKR